MMTTVIKFKVMLFMDRISNQWVVWDPEGNFWIIPSREKDWESHQPFHLTEQSELEAVPGHYIHMLNLPF